MGDPETEVVLPRVKNDLIDVFTACANGKLSKIRIELDPRTVTTVMLVSGGYPESYEKGKEISLPKIDKDSIIFQAGTKSEEHKILSNGGRVLAISSFGNSIEEAVSKSLNIAKDVHFEGKYYRSDIGKDLM